MNNPRIKNIIDELSKNKIITVSIQNNNLIIEKQTMKEGYSNLFAQIDVNDIEQFYNIFINSMIPQNNKLYNNSPNNI